MDDIDLPAYLIPVTRADCINGRRPCPWIRCRQHHFWWHHRIHPKTGEFRTKKTDEELSDFVVNMKNSCTLDVIDRARSVFGDTHCTLQEIANACGFTRERARQYLDGHGRHGKRRGGAIPAMRHHVRQHYLTDFIGYEHRDAACG